MRDLLMRDLLMRDLLERGLLERTLRAFIAIEEVGEVLGLVGVDPNYDPGFTPGLFE
jgi:hypothetical protein